MQAHEGLAEAAEYGICRKADEVRESLQDRQKRRCKRKARNLAIQTSDRQGLCNRESEAGTGLVIS